MNKTSSANAGDKIGLLKLIEPLERRTKNKCIRWLCLCDCGHLTVAESGNLQSGNTLSCGCLHPDPPRAKSAVYPGYISGQLTVVEEMLTRASGGAKRWLCQCECGQRLVVRAGHLAKNATQSCGCSRRKKSE